MVHFEIFPRVVVETVDKIIGNVDNHSGVIETNKDWEVVRALFVVWKKFFPQEYKDQIKEIKSLRRRAHNEYQSVKGNQEFRHLIEIPFSYKRLLIAVFYNQNWKDKKLLRKMAQQVPELKVPEKI